MKNKTNLIFITYFILILYSCDKGNVEKLPSSSLYKNHSKNVKYVGKNECKKCHSDIYNSYIVSEMGRSFSRGLPLHSKANFHQIKPIFDSTSSFYYLPFIDDSLLFLKEYKLDVNGDTIYQRIEQLNYIIGSGQHTNSHFVVQNGYVYQAPATFYTQKGEWHLPPGFEKGNNTRYDRIIGEECMTCHNGYAQYIEGSKNKFSELPEGIDCERCHGPGEIHVQEKRKGILVDITKEIDYSIVNPAKLSSDLQMDVCQRCHLQGISSLKEGKTYYDFIPGMKLNSMYEVYQARFKDSDQNFIMASHSDRLQMSQCFIVSRTNENQKDLTCITCHNPHVSVKSVSSDDFNSKCITCHTDKKCTKTTETNCISCHMKKASSYDIPHVNITDHFITKIPKSRAINLAEKPQSELEKQNDFIQLFCRTNNHPEPLSNANAYLNYYEKYAQNGLLLDSALYYLTLSKENSSILNKYYVRLYFLKKQYKKVIELSSNNEFSDAWTNYRIGQSYFNQNEMQNAAKNFEKAVKKAPLDIDFRNKLASTYMELKRHAEAKEVLENTYLLNPKVAQTNNLLGLFRL